MDVKTVFLENGAFGPYRTQVVRRKVAKMTIYILPTKTRGCRPQSPETDGNDENGGCPSDKATVCENHCLEAISLLNYTEKFQTWAKSTGE